MNKVILTGRLTRNPELTYSTNNLAIAKYTLAIDRKCKKGREQETDFIPCVVFGKSAEFAKNYFLKGLMIGVEGRLQISSWNDDEGKPHQKSEIIVEEQEFLESKRSFEARGTKETSEADESLPF